MNKEERLKKLRDWELYYYNLYQKNYDNKVLRGKYFEKWKRYKGKAREFLATDGRGYEEKIIIKTSNLTPDQEKAVETFLKQEVSGDNSKRLVPMPVIDTGMLKKSITINDVNKTDLLRKMKKTKRKRLWWNE